MDFNVWFVACLAGVIFCIVGLALASWWTTKTINLLLASHTQILKHQILLDQAVLQGGAHMVPMNNWRQLPADAQLMMRNSLIEIIREMDGEMPKRH